VINEKIEIDKNKTAGIENIAVEVLIVSSANACACIKSGVARYFSDTDPSNPDRRSTNLERIPIS
jgi:hypothetical protein